MPGAGRPAASSCVRARSRGNRAPSAWDARRVSGARGCPRTPGPARPTAGSRSAPSARRRERRAPPASPARRRRTPGGRRASCGRAAHRRSAAAPGRARASRSPAAPPRRPARAARSGRACSSARGSMNRRLITRHQRIDRVAAGEREPSGTVAGGQRQRRQKRVRVVMDLRRSDRHERQRQHEPGDDQPLLRGVARARA